MAVQRQAFEKVLSVGMPSGLMRSLATRRGSRLLFFLFLGRVVVAVGLLLRPVEREEHLGPADIEHHYDRELCDLPVREVLLHLVPQRLIHFAASLSQRQLAGEAQRRLLGVVEGAVLEIVQRVDLLLADTVPLRRSGVDGVSEMASVHLGETQL